MLNALWANYKNRFVEAESGRTLDPHREDVTTSESQSYTMLRAVWQDDKETFDMAWNWTKQHLDRPEDNLFAWLYGKRADGTYGILTERGGQNTASDADSDIALALIFASNRWGQEAYLSEAKAIINDIWQQEIVAVLGVPHMTADNLEKDSTTVVLINPSYLSPASYKIFAQVDPAHNWEAVADSSYMVIEKSSDLNLAGNGQNGVGLPPDWIALDVNTGELKLSEKGDSNFGFDALRVPFRLALDYLWFQDERAKQTLENFEFLNNQWKEKQLLYATYGNDGTVVSNFEAPAMYGGVLGYFLVHDREAAEEIYKAKLQNLYKPDQQDFIDELSYYDSNWAWFGLALYNNRLINLYQPNLSKAP